MSKQEDVVIIGGGVIGVCAAYFLTKAGRTVTLLEQGEIGSGSSYGNAGLIVPNHVIPLAAPGVLTQGLKWLLNPESPFYVKPRLDFDLLAWLWRFQAACREDKMRRAIPVLRDLGRASAALYRQLVAEEKLDCGYERRGLIMLFKSERGYEEGLAEARLLREFGLSPQPVSADEVRGLIPSARADIAGGVRFPNDAHLNPARFVQELAARVQALGGTIHTQTKVTGFGRKDHRLVSVKTSGGDFRPQQVVLAAGSWSPAVARDLRLRLPVQAAKGYSLTSRRPEACPPIPLLLGEAKVAVTPLGPLMRLAGTLELAGLDLSINRRRVEAIQRAAGDYLTGLEAPESVEVWGGLRPCTPDGLPVIGRTAAYDNLIVATGHAMKGMALGPITGQLVAQLACDQPPSLDLTPLRVERFG
ncbi:MAG: NAD(P)/FAD-dependent oxidoreductase [Anaerolineae bacterium]